MKIKQLLLKWHNSPIWQKILVCLVLGMGTGLFFGPKALVLKPLGDIFISALNMVIVPVILSAVVCAVMSIADDFHHIKRITLKALVVYLSLLCIATLIAIFVGNVLQPGAGLSPTTSIVETAASQSSGGLHQNILQIVLFGIFLGVAINLSGTKGEQVANLFKSIAEVSKNLSGIIMEFAPYGAFALISCTFAEHGIDAIGSILGFIMSVLLSCLILVFVVYGSVITFYLKSSPLTFIKKIMPAIMFAIGTTSSGATLPVSMRCAEEELRVPPNISKFLLPLGCNFNLSGLAIYLTLAVIFTANMYNIVMTPYAYLVLILTVVVTTMGTGAVAGSAVIVMSGVITGMGMPLGALSLFIGVDRINDMIQTTTNVISDIFAAYLISESERQDNIIADISTTELPIDLSAELKPEFNNN